MKTKRLPALLGCFLACVASTAAADPKEQKLVTSILVVKESSVIYKVPPIVTKVGKQHGFTTDAAIEVGIYQEFRNGTDGAFIVDWKSANEVHLYVENVSDRKCFVVRVYSNSTKIGDIALLRAAIDSAVIHELGKTVKIYPDSICGAAGEARY